MPKTLWTFNIDTMAATNHVRGQIDVMAPDNTELAVIESRILANLIEKSVNRAIRSYRMVQEGKSHG